MRYVFTANFHDGSSHIPFHLLSFVCLAIDLLIMLALSCSNSIRTVLWYVWHLNTCARSVSMCHTEAMQLYRKIFVEINEVINIYRQIALLAAAMETNTWECGSHPRQNRIIESLTVPLFTLCYAFSVVAGTNIKGINITALIDVQSSVCITNGRDENNQPMNTHTLSLPLPMCLSVYVNKSAENIFNVRFFQRISVHHNCTRWCDVLIIFFLVYVSLLLLKLLCL